MQPPMTILGHFLNTFPRTDFSELGVTDYSHTSEQTQKGQRILYQGMQSITTCRNLVYLNRNFRRPAVCKRSTYCFTKLTFRQGSC